MRDFARRSCGQRLAFEASVCLSCLLSSVHRLVTQAGGEVAAAS